MRFQSMPGFSAETSLTVASQHPRSHALRFAASSMQAVTPALQMLEAYSSNDGGVEDACAGLYRCCKQGYVDCCIAYRKGCT